MDAGFLIPFFDRGEEIFRDLFKTFPIQIIPFREIILVAMLASQIAKVSDMPLNIKMIFHKYLEESFYFNHLKIKAKGLQISFLF